MNNKLRRRICEIIYTEKEKSSTTIINDNEIYCTIYINPYKFHGICGQRFDTIYCDSRFMDSYSGRELIENVFKPMNCIYHPKGEGFRLFNWSDKL